MSEIKLAGGWTIENVREEILEHIWIDETGDMGGVHCMHCLGYEQGEIDRILELATSALREQNRVLREALQAAKYELAALFPIPSAPTVHAALEVCGNNNEADARCIYLAYEAICAALTATSQPKEVE